MSGTAQFYYAKEPTEAAPVTALVGPFHTVQAAKHALMDDVKVAEDDLVEAAPWGAYQILSVVALVRPVVNHNVRLETLQ